MLAMLQTILAASNNGQDSPWTQLLVILAIAVVYGVKTLVKAKKSFIDEQDEPDEPPIPPQRQAGKRPQQAKPKLTMIQQQQYKPAFEPEPVAGESVVSLIKTQEIDTGPQEEIELDLDNTDSLRKAIIYSEILGKPISLRQGS